MLTSSTARTLTVVSLVLLGSVGCSGVSEEGSAAPTPGEYEQTDLEALLYEVGTVWEGREAEQFRLVQDAIAECMREQGFEYRPQTSPPEQVNPADLGALPGTIEFAEQYGYGITTDPFRMTGEEFPAEGDDPNAELLGDLTDAELAAYYAALYGTGTEVTDWRDMGCTGRADHEVNGTVPGLDEDAFAGLMSDLADLWSVTSDPSLEPLVAEWAECMSDAGYPGLESIDQPAAEFARQNAQGGDLDALAEDEIEMASADARCRESVGYTRALREFQVELQDEFYAANRAELEAWRDGLRELAGG